jgi:hypothetical protein
MNPELTKKLYEKYPSIFANRCGFDHGDGWYGIIDAMCEAMTQAYSTFIEIDESLGREWGIAPLKGSENSKPAFMFEVQPAQVIAHQVKEKLGTLRFYYGLEFDPRFHELAYGETPLPEATQIAERYRAFIDGIVHLAKVVSVRTCEETGLAGEMHASGGKAFGWRRTLNREFARTDPFCVDRNYQPIADLIGKDSVSTDAQE